MRRPLPASRSNRRLQRARRLRSDVLASKKRMRTKVVSVKFIVVSVRDMTYFVSDLRESASVHAGNGARKKANTAAAPSQSRRSVASTGTKARDREVSNMLLCADCYSFSYTVACNSPRHKRARSSADCQHGASHDSK